MRSLNRPSRSSSSLPLPLTSISISLITLLALPLALAMFASPAFAAQGHEQVVYSLSGFGNLGLSGALVADKAGNLYGTGNFGNVAPCYCGLVYELSPPAAAGGTWTATMLYAFKGENNGDGANPYGTMIFDEQGNLYGTTQAGGINNAGTVFELSPPASAGGSWTETVLYIFPGDGSLGDWPEGNLVFDAQGNLYGTTSIGGSVSTLPCYLGCGVFFQLLAPVTPGGAWTMGANHSFGTTAGDGMQPTNSVIYRNGAIYGITQSGGSGSCQDGCGTIYEFVVSNNQFTEQILYSFEPTDNAWASFGGVIFDPKGNIYGTTRQGGNLCAASIYATCGTVFELSPAGAGWTFSTLYLFTGGLDGGNPYDTLLRDGSGNLYGTANVGGWNNRNSRNNGTVFKLSPPTAPGGTWTETTLHDFMGPANGDGASPYAGLIEVHNTLFGTATLGEDVFAIAP
jgi:uncharacterized repeat protein (TIGR03803 family)